MDNLNNTNEEDRDELEQCFSCGAPCEHLYCDKCDKEISDYEFDRVSGLLD